MTAKKTLSAFLSLAVAYSAAHAQDQSLVIELPPYSVLDTAAGKSAEKLSSPIERKESPKLIADAQIERVQPAQTIADANAEIDYAANAAELIRQRFANGKIQLERWVIEDAHGNIVNHGSYVEYDQQGNSVASGEFVYGQREGTWSKQLTAEQTRELAGHLDEGFSAPFISKATFEDGLLQGVWTISDSRGNLVTSWSYEAGNRDGVSSLRNSKGEVVQSVTYRMNVAHGPAKIGFKGEPAKETVLTEGMLLRQVDKWYPAVAGKQAVLQSQEWQLVPIPMNVVSSEWYANEVRLELPAGAETVRHGMAVTFYSNGQRESEGSYDHGLRNGTFAWWYANGQQKTVGEYRDDVENGDWNWWHENGMKQASGLFANGKRVDEWSLWTAEGKLVQRTNASKSETQVADTNNKPAAESKTR